MFLIGILLIVFGVLMLIRPNLIWLLTESWKSTEISEPSSLYLMSTRFGGIMCILVGAGAIAAFLWSKK
ncbi:hypothetical protein SY83_02460 [Paenibacillus swuensis]|uniref:DUF6199 domain-containing protein n=2 Tax=Paenibacillus swuensis TaxID=1178515 RepID=A0A172TE90_9BACL|nr:hypothetical protein SY83_02460 [Paenibacillus swuensis]